MTKHFLQTTLISIATLGAFTIAPAYPQSANQATPALATASPQQHLNHLTRKLALTADQQNQILPILTDRDQQTSDIKNDASLNPKQRHAKMLAVRSDAQSKIRSVLTDQQRAAYDQMQQQARDRANARKQGSVSN